MFTEKAFVIVKDSNGKEVAKQEYDKVRFAPNSKDAKEMADQFAAVPDGELLKQAIEFLKAQDPKSNAVHDLLQNVEYAYDLAVRSKIRQGLVAAIAGPDKAIDRAVADLMKVRAAMGRPITEEKARAIITAE